MSTQLDIEKAVRYITENIETTEKLEFESWLSASDDNRSEFNEFKAFWVSTGKTYEDYRPNVFKAWKVVKKGTILAPKTKPKTKQLYKQLIRAAAVAVILLSIGYLAKTGYDWMQQEELVCYSSANTVMTISLSDGSIVWLNTGSSITVPKEFKGNQRKVYLKGNAFFEVTKNPYKPFLISANHTLTKVLGTSFYLTATNEDSVVALTVVTGKVSFSNENDLDEVLILHPGQRGIIDLAKGEKNIENNKDQNFLAWKTGKIEFNNASLEEVCKTLSDYYRVNIDPGVFKNNKNFLFSGNFDNKPLIEVLNVVELTLGIKFEKYDQSFVVKLTE